MIKIHPPKKNISVVILTCAGFLTAVSIYTLLYIYPSFRSLSSTNQIVLEKQAEFERLNILFPVFAKSQTLSNIKFEQKLPLLDRKQVRHNELTECSREISNIAEYNNMTLFSSNFDINSLQNSSGFVSLAIELEGTLSDFRPFLIDIIALEFFDSVKTLNISVTNKKSLKHFSIKLDIKAQKR